MEYEFYVGVQPDDEFDILEIRTNPDGQIVMI